MSNTEERLRTIFADHLAPRDPITRETHLFDDLGADSLDTVELHIATEEEFGVTIDEGEWEEVATFGAALILVEGAVK